MEKYFNRRYILLILGSLVLLGVSACSDEPESGKPDYDDENKENKLALIDFDGYRIGSITPEIESVAYNVTRKIYGTSTFYDLRINARDYYFGRDYVYYPYYISYDIGEIPVYREPTDDWGHVSFTPEGYFSELSYESNYFYSGTSTYWHNEYKFECGFKYNNYGNLIEISERIIGDFFYSHKDYDDRWEPIWTNKSSTETVTIKTSLYWKNGNLYEIVRTSETIGEGDGKDKPSTTETYNISYDMSISNPFRQYPISFSFIIDKLYSTWHPYRHCLPFGVFGRGPGNIPVSVEHTDENGEKRFLPLIITMGDISDATTRKAIVREEYDGTTYEYTYKPAE